MQQRSNANRFQFFQQPGSRFYSVRMMVGGKRRWFSTGETSIKKAQYKSAAIKSRGFKEATKLHSKRRDEIPEDPTIYEFAELDWVVIATAEAPPSRTTSERYIRCLERVCEGAGVKRVSRLNHNTMMASQAGCAADSDNLPEVPFQLTPLP